LPLENGGICVGICRGIVKSFLCCIFVKIEAGLKRFCEASMANELYVANL
jgi:hypothetical protein